MTLQTVCQFQLDLIATDNYNTGHYRRAHLHMPIDDHRTAPGQLLLDPPQQKTTFRDKQERRRRLGRLGGARHSFS
jgi:hypothetical protein